MECADNFLFEVKQSIKFGRYLVAKKNIGKGECILKESPLVVFPMLEGVQGKDRTMKPTCTSCLESVDNNSTVRCKYCDWPFCSTVCIKDSHHRAMECDLFRKNATAWSAERVRQLYLVRSFIIRSRDPNKWEQIMELVSTYGKDNPVSIRCNNWAIETGKTFLEDCNINVTRNEIKKLVRIFEINSFYFETDYESKRNPSKTRKEKYCVLYGKSSLFAHSCAPNVEFMKVTIGKDRRAIGFYAMNDIKEGEMLTISYTESFISQPTKERRISLFNVLSFICGCSRCNDPTELGTFYSSVKCPQCIDGWLNPPDSPSKKRYNCNSCWYSMMSNYVEEMEHKFKRMVQVTTEKSEMKRLKMMGNLISKATSLYKLHANHHLVIEATETWLSSFNLSSLLKSSPECQATYLLILERARRLLAICRIFGIVAKQIQLEAIIATAILRYDFKCPIVLPVIKDCDSSEEKETKIKEITIHLRKFIDPRISEFCHSEVLVFLMELEKRYSK